MNRGRSLAAFAVAGLVVFSAVPGFSAADGHNFIAYYGLAVLGLWLLPVHWTARLFATVCGLSAAWTQVLVANGPGELSGVFTRIYLSGNADFQMACLFLVFWAILARARPNMAAWLDFLCVCALVECLRISAQRLGWDPVFSGINGAALTRAAGSQGNVGWTGIMLALCLPGFFRPRVWPGALAVCGALVIEKSLTPVIAAAASSAWFAWHRFPGRWRLALVPAALIVVSAYAIYDPGDSNRFVNWARAIELCSARESWLTGYGLGSWIVLFPAPGTCFHRAHCEPLQVWFELGAAGVLCLALYARMAILRIAAAGRSGAGLFASAGLAAVAVASLGNFPFHLAGTAVFAVGWMALFEISTEGA